MRKDCEPLFSASEVEMRTAHWMWQYGNYWLFVNDNLEGRMEGRETKLEWRVENI